MKAQARLSGLTLPQALTEITRILQNGELANVAGFVLRAAESLLPHMLEELPRERHDLVIFDSIALWGKMAATRLSLSCPQGVPLKHLEQLLNGRSVARLGAGLVIDTVKWRIRRQRLSICDRLLMLF